MFPLLHTKIAAALAKSLILKQHQSWTSDLWTTKGVQEPIKYKNTEESDVEIQLKSINGNSVISELYVKKDPHIWELYKA